MRSRDRRFRRRRRLRLWSRGNRMERWGLFDKISLWWNRRKFYTFHKDEVITQKHTCTSPLAVNEEEDEELEWNNDSESEDPEQYSDAASKHDDRASSLGSDFGDYDDGTTLMTIEEDSPFDDSLETIEEEMPMDESARLGSKPKVSPFFLSNQQSPPQQQQQPRLFVAPAAAKSPRRGAAGDSISGSLESMDSLLSSQWDPEDDASTMTPLVTNIHSPTESNNDAFFVEHVRFLQIQTQPRKVEEVYRNGSSEKPANE